MIADASATPAGARPTCSRRPSTARTPLAPAQRRSPRCRPRRRARCGHANVEVETSRRSTRRLLARTNRARACRALARDAGGRARPACATPAASSFAPRPSSATTRPVRRTCCPTRRPRARRRRARPGVVPEADPGRPRERRRVVRAREIALPLARVEGLPLHAAALEARVTPVTRAAPRTGLRAVRLGDRVGRGRGAARIATGAGAALRPEHAARARRPAGAARRELRRLNRYPDGRYRELREAAAAYCGVGRDRSSSARARTT